jgi:methionyl-tRNA synthetase
VQEDYLDHNFHPDLLRYYLISYTSHTKEVNFSWKVFQERINSELVAVLGNFLYRSLLFNFKNFGQIPSDKISPDIMEKIKTTIDEVIVAMEQFEFKKAIDTAMALASFGNSYFQSNEPWKLIKENKEACANVLANCMQIAKALILLFEPTLPDKMEIAWKQIGMDSNVHAVKYEEALIPIKAGTKLSNPTILFDKIEDSKIDEMTLISNERIRKAMAKEAGIPEGTVVAVPPKDEITYEDFAKLDIRVGKIISAEKIKKSKKLLKLMVDVGESKPRQIVAGLAEYYQPEELVGKIVNVIVNLQPAKLCGVESQGMLLAADAGKRVSLLTPDKEMQPGSIIR